MVFFNRPGFYDRALDDSANVTAERAVIFSSHEQEQPGVVIRNGKFPKAVLTADAAHRLAIEIVDALEEAQRRPAPLKRQTAVSEAFQALGDM